MDYGSFSLVFLQKIDGFSTETNTQMSERFVAPTFHHQRTIPVQLLSGSKAGHLYW